MIGSGTGDLSMEWWENLTGVEPMLDESAEPPKLQTWSWADQQADECSYLDPLCFSEDVSPLTDQCQLPVPIGDKLEVMYLDTPEVHAASESPRRSAFKDSFSNRSPAAPDTTTDGTDYAGQHLSSNVSGSVENKAHQHGGGKELLDVQLLSDEGSDCMTCSKANILKESRSHRSNSDKGSSNALEMESESRAKFFHDSNFELSEHEGDSSNPGGGEVDLQCKGEQLNLECEDDSSGDASKHWIKSSTKGCLGFIPISNAVLPEMPSLSQDNPSRGGGQSSGLESESADDNGDMSSSPGKAPASVAPEGAGDVRPEMSTPESTLSEGTTTSVVDGKRRGGKLVDVASVTDITAVGGSTNRKRPGRSSKPTTAATEARSSAATKRKRATTSRPAAPSVSGQACTQCFTHVTPVWRAGPEGPKTLCNACGVRYMKVAKRK